MLDEVASRLGAGSWKTKDDARQVHVAAARVVLVKPLSYMNESGVPLARIAAWWKAPPAGLLVISDDLDLPLGRLRLRPSGGSGGHNGLRSIIEHFGEDFPRLRVGIGRGDEADAIDRVLSRFDDGEERVLREVVATAAEGVERWLAQGTAAAIPLLNGWRAAEDTKDGPPDA